MNRLIECLLRQLRKGHIRRRKYGKWSITLSGLEQQLHAMKRYTDEHNIRNCWFVYVGTGGIDYTYYQIPCKLLPTVVSIWCLS